MSIRKGLTVGLMIVFFLPLSCARLDQEAGKGTAPLVLEEMPADGSVPVEYGNLISVSSFDEAPGWVQLWFQNDEGVVRMVQYSFRNNNFNRFSYRALRN